MLKVAELRAQGKSAEEIKRFVADAFAKGCVPAANPVGRRLYALDENLVPSDKGIAVPFHPT